MLQSIVSRKGSSKVLTFSIPHVFKALQILNRDRYVSRSTFCKELKIGEGAVKTLILHLKEAKIVESNRSGTFLTEKGTRFSEKLMNVIASECSLKKCNIAPEKFNHAILLRSYASAVKTGVEQRDYAIMYGASSTTTLRFINGKFAFPKEDFDPLENDFKTKNFLIENLNPENQDAIIIASSSDPFVAEISAKNSALWTLATHEKH